ncbi:MAG: threonine--tRNA ligase [Firmicutes bacterium]|jgi:threonyl-tRNA synthetase|nr:threonine--tRNA ligase [Bacillota bacterium]
MAESNELPAKKVVIQLKDWGSREITVGTTILEMLGELSPKLKKEALAARLNGKIVDLNTPLQEDASVDILTFDDPEGAEVYRHTASHVLAQAVKRLYGNVRLGIGPPISNGFYYDFDFATPISPEDLEKIEEQVKQIIKEDLPLQRLEVSREEALKTFQELGEPFKVELISDLPEGDTISCYRQGEFIDLCAGPHLPSTGKLGSFKLLNLAGAYWRGNERNPMLQRIYGTAFPRKELLEEYLHLLEEARKRDHRKLGRELDLFSFHEEAPGFPFYHPRGIIVRRELEKFWREEHQKAGYQEVETPIILNRFLWEQSGHWEHYREDMYFTKIDGQDYAVKPMNCPGSMLIYRTGMHSYRDFPLRMAEMGLVHRHEKSGTLHGLMRVRCFTQDDAHIFMLPEQIEDEVAGVIELVDRFYRVFGFNYHVELSTRPEKSMGSDEMWEKATSALQSVLDKRGMPYKINEGDGAFYGPKIDFHLQDSLGRTWQCGTIQLDFQMPEKFDLSYIGPDGQKHRPAMIHRVVYGSMERFLALLIEHYGGAFPLWLAPVQAVVIPITDRQRTYALEIKDQLRSEKVRVEMDDRNEKVGYKIREAQVQKIPYMLVIGDKEVAARSVAVRHREQGDLGAVPLDSFVAKIKEEINEKK